MAGKEKIRVIDIRTEEEIMPTVISKFHFEQMKEFLTCYYCEDDVSFACGEINTPHFRHKSRTGNHDDCDAYTKSFYISSSLGSRMQKKIRHESKKSSFLYLKRENGAFVLSIALPRFKSEEILECETTNAKVSIVDCYNEYQEGCLINRSNFLPDERKEFVVKPAERYSILIESESKKSISKNDIAGITSYGALFRTFDDGFDFSEVFARRMNAGDKVFCNQIYYFLVKIFDNSYLDIEYEKVGQISRIYDHVDISKRIYRIKFKSLCCQNIEFCRRMNLELCAEKKELFHLWPPSAIYDEKHLLSNATRSFFVSDCAKDSLMLKNCILNCEKAGDRFLYENRHFVGATEVKIFQKFNQCAENLEYEFKQNSPIELQSSCEIEEIFDLNKAIEFHEDKQCTVFHYRKGFPIKAYKTSRASYEIFKYGDELLFCKGNYVIRKIIFVKSKTISKAVSDFTDMPRMTKRISHWQKSILSSQDRSQNMFLKTHTQRVNACYLNAVLAYEKTKGNTHE